jgi:hypothetical protein
MALLRSLRWRSLMMMMMMMIERVRVHDQYQYWKDFHANPATPVRCVIS